MPLAPTTAEKYAALRTRVGELGSVLVAFSGGIDSTLLAFTAHDVLGEAMVAALASSATYPESEIVTARALAGELGLNLVELYTDELSDPDFTANTPDRCYHCKLELFGMLGRLAQERGLACVADGNNADDLGDHRPGRRAAAEFSVVSPLAEVGLTKTEIRELAHELGLPNWDKPSMACLASRFPYAEPITAEKLTRVGAAEDAVRALGLKQFRVRAHDTVARIEVAPDELDAAWAQREALAAAMREAGFAYAALDLEGYRTGSLNEVLAASEREEAASGGGPA